MNKGHLTNKTEKDKKELHWTKDSIIEYVYNVSDEVRIKYLNSRKVKPALVDKTKLTKIDITINNDKLKDMKEKVLPLVSELYGVYSSDDIDLKFNWSKTKFKESARKIYERKQSNLAFAKMFTCFEDIVKNSVLVEVHDDIYKDTRREDVNLDKSYVLLSAFTDDEKIYPVEMLVKNFKDRNSALHMVITIGEIKKTRIVPASQQLDATYTSPLVSYNVKDIISFVKDGDFLKYIPSQMLSNKQIIIKNEAIKREQNRLLKFL